MHVTRERADAREDEVRPNQAIQTGNSADNALLIRAAAEALRFLDKYGVTSPSETVLEDLAFAEDIELKTAPLVGAEAHRLWREVRSLTRCENVKKL